MNVAPQNHRALDFWQQNFLTVAEIVKRWGEMTRIYTETTEQPQEIIELLKSAVSSKIARIQPSIDMT